jgi:hypothetical protein
MADSKIEFSYDNLHFSCEGEKEWVENQLNQVLNRIPGLNQPVPVAKKEETAEISIPEKVKKPRGRRPKSAADSADQGSSKDPLMEFLKEKNADKNQVKKFLAVAVYLHAHGVEKFSTPLISKTLKNAGIEKLINASDCLNKNEKKGFCIKEDKEFVLTDLGIRAILGAEEES